MSLKKWKAVDQYISDQLIEQDAALDAALKASDAAGLPQINVSPAQGKFLNLLAQVLGSRRILEIGTLGGYSTIWLARALPKGGKLVTLEYDPEHARVARANLAKAKLSSKVDLRVGAALSSLPKIASEKLGPFDLVFIDADKENNPAYFKWALKLTHKGSVIIVDNVIREGEVLNARSRDPRIRGTRALYRLLSAEKRVEVTAIQTVGSKGYDGFALARVK